MYFILANIKSICDWTAAWTQNHLPTYLLTTDSIRHHSGVTCVCVWAERQHKSSYCLTSRSQGCRWSAAAVWRSS